jgi:phage-related protein
METFLYAYIADFGGTASARSKFIQFGDGYSQRSPDGLNAESEQWDIEVGGLNLAQKNDLDGFIDRHGGHKAFLWTPNGEVQGKYIFVQPVKRLVKRGGGSLPYYYSRQLTLKKVNDL